MNDESMIAQAAVPNQATYPTEAKRFTTNEDFQQLSEEGDLSLTNDVPSAESSDFEL